MPKLISRIDYRPPRRDESEMLTRAQKFHEELITRRSVREFSSDPILDEVSRACDPIRIVRREQ